MTSFAFAFGCLCLIGWWADWALTNLLGKEISYWLCVAAYAILAIFLPTKVKPWLMPFPLIVATFWIWFS